MSATTPLQPARLEFADGLPWSSAFDDVYHSRSGGLGQARHVFLAGNRLPERWADRARFVILETGFGLGLNFLATWQAWRHDPARCQQLHFISVEKHPFRREDLATLHQQWPELAELAARLQAQWPLLVAGFHRLQLEPGVSLTLILGDALHWLPQLEAEVDAFYLDGFAPSKNPDLWNERLFRQIARLAHPHATCATYSVARVVRDGLQTAGFSVEKWPGYSGKRDMLHGHYTRPRPVHRAGSAARRALVIGAGLAGSSIAWQLARRGWQVTLLERHAQPAQEASGNHAGIVQPVLSLDDNLQSRLSRVAMDYAWRHLAALEGVPHARCGVLQLADDAAHAQRQQQIIETLHLPAEFASHVDQATASALAGQTLPCGGWWFAGGGWVQPPALVRAQMQHPRIQGLYQQPVNRLQRSGEHWQALDAQQQVIAEAPILILANAAEAAHLLPGLPLEKLRRQVSYLPACDMPSVSTVLCRDGYLIPGIDGIACLGASRDDQAAEFEPSVHGHAQNLLKLQQMLPHAAPSFSPAQLTGRSASRPTTPDRLPLVGLLPDFATTPRSSTSQLFQLPRQAGLYGLLGFGARGLTWSALCAELLACQISGEPLPLPRDLVHALDPGRFWLRQLRQLT